jgi:hypothetical protein
MGQMMLLIPCSNEDVAAATHVRMYDQLFSAALGTNFEKSEQWLCCGAGVAVDCSLFPGNWHSFTL